jgi:protein TonB
MAVPAPSRQQLPSLPDRPTLTAPSALETVTQQKFMSAAVTAQAAPVAATNASAVQTENARTGAASEASGGTNGEQPSASAQGNVVPPVADAAYLHNPEPDYPPMSVLRHETGIVTVGVLIGVDGRAQAARIAKSSGYARLDEEALTTARDRWRYRPGTRGGVPEAMWFNVPIKFKFPE